MSKKINRDGWFRAYITASGCEINKKNGNIQFVASLEAVEEYDFDLAAYIDITGTEEREITAYLTLYSSKYPDTVLFFGEQLQHALDWNGNINVLNVTDYSKIPVLIHIEEEEFEKKLRLKVTRIGHAEDTPGGTVTKADESELDAAMAKFSGAQKILMGGDKPKTVPGKVGKPITKPAIPKTDNKAAMAAAGEQAKADVDADREQAEYSAMSPADKKAFNKAIKAKTASAKAAIAVPGRKKTTAPASVPVAAEVESDPTTELIDALNLPASCTKDQAWEACEANVHPDNIDKIAEVWSTKVRDYGNDKGVEDAKAWPEVRQTVLAALINEPS